MIHRRTAKNAVEASGAAKAARESKSGAAPAVLVRQDTPRAQQERDISVLSSSCPNVDRGQQQAGSGTETHVTEQYLERFSWFIEPLLKLGKTPHRMMASPMTSIARARKEFIAGFERRRAEVGDDGLLEDLVGVWIPRSLWEDVPRLVAQHYDETRAKACRTEHGRAAFDVVERAHRTVAFSPLFAIAEPTQRGLSILKARGLLLESSQYRSEPRCEKLLHAAHVAAEEVYQGCLEQLWKLDAFCNGKAPEDAPSLGQLVRALGNSKLVPPILIDDAVAHMRNAIAHGHAHYDPELRVARLQDRNWNCTLAVRRIEHSVEQWLDAESHVNNAVLAFTVRSLTTAMSPFLADMGEALRDRASSESLDKIGDALNREMESLFAPAGRLHSRLERG